MEQYQVSERIAIDGKSIRSTVELQPYVVEGRVDTNVIIGCFDKFSETITKNTIMILDASTSSAQVMRRYTSKPFLENIDKWQERGLFVYQLPPYSPTLNVIEILWRNIKNRWLPMDAYESFDSLKRAIEEIFINYGAKY